MLTTDRRYAAEPSAHPTQHHGHGGQHALGGLHRVLGGELELGQGIGSAGAHAEGVDEGVFAGPAVAAGFGLGADGIGVDGHRPYPSS
jgi:hypothetical protein